MDRGPPWYQDGWPQAQFSGIDFDLLVRNRKEQGEIINLLSEVNFTRSELEFSFFRLQYDDANYFNMATAFLIFFLHPGFAFLEAGSVRSKNATNILFKNVCDICVAGLAYWSFGYGLSYGKPSNPMIGYGWFFGAEMPLSQYATWFAHFCYAATAATIVAGALAERCGFTAYVVYSTVITGFLYPVLTHWCWADDGWLKHLGFLDTAGSGVVHLTGGICALVGAIILGPRLGRFDDNGNVQDIKGHSVMFATLGGFALMFGFFPFNANSVAANHEGSDRVALAMVNTTVAGCAAGLTTLMVSKPLYRKWSLLFTVNGLLSGMVAICAGCDSVRPWAALVTGILAGLSYVFWSWFTLYRLKIDDPLDAFAVHGGAGGFVGLLTRPIFQYYPQPGIVYAWDSTSFRRWGINIFGLVIISLWSAVLCSIVFGLLRVFKKFRVKEEYEIRGLDIPKHGEPAYPISAYWSGWEDVNEDASKPYLTKLNSKKFASDPNLVEGDIPNISNRKSSKIPYMRIKQPQSTFNMKPTIAEDESQHEPDGFIFRPSTRNYGTLNGATHDSDV